MAVITFDHSKQNVVIMVEKSDLIYDKEDNIVEISSGSKHLAGKVFVNGEISTLIVRGERDK